MPWREDYFTFPNPSDPVADRIRVRLNVVRGRLEDFVMQYEVLTDKLNEGYVAVVRYEGSHDRAHRDLLDAAGQTVRKTWLQKHLTMDEALQFAMTDIEQNWRRYRDEFRWRSK